MELLLKVISPEGQISLLPLDSGRIEIAATPGARYQLILDDPGQPARPRVMRLVDDLVVDGLPTGDEIQLTGFFTACTPAASCRFEVYLDDDPVASALVTPASEPVAAITGGGFIMAEPGAPAAALPTPPESEPAPIWRPIMAGGAGLLVLGAAAGAGGGGSADVTAPTTPVVASDTAVNTRFPQLSGTAEPGSQVTVILTPPDGQTVVYATRAGDDGNWAVATASATPQSGAFPADGLADGETVTIEVLARDASGNLSPAGRGSIQIDATAPAAPTLAVENGTAGGAPPLLNADDLGNGLTVSGTAEAGSTITLTLSGIGLERQTAVNADGRFSTTLGDAGLALADGRYTVTARAADAAGNVGPDAGVSFDVDRTLSPIRAEFGEVIDDRAPRVGELPEGASSNDRTPALRGALAGTLADDEQLLVLLDGTPLGAATTQPGSWEFTVPTPLAEGDHVFTLRLVDDAGNARTPGSAQPRSLTIDTTAPDDQPLISAVLDDSGAVTLQVPNGGVSLDATPRVRITLDELLERGESVVVQRTSGGTLVDLGAAAPVLGDTSGLAYEVVDAAAPPGTSVAYRALIVDAAGLTGPLSPVYAIQLAASPNASDIV